MSKPTVLLHKFRSPIFKGIIWIIIGNTVKDAMDFAEDKTSETIAREKEKKYIRAYTYAYESESSKRRYMLFFKHTAKPGEISHEVKHLINIMFSWHGYKLSLTNDEMECYYLEDIVDRVHNTITRYKKLYKKPKPKQLDQNNLNAILF
jgi:hypothetical protein